MKGQSQSGSARSKKLIEDAYRLGEAMGLSVWCTDQAGPFQTMPYPGQSWRPEGEPARQPHEYLRDGTAKVLTLFHPADGRVRLHGVTPSLFGQPFMLTTSPNRYGLMPFYALHAWLFRGNPLGQLQPWNPRVSC